MTTTLDARLRFDGECEGDGATDAPPGAGDDCDLIGQPKPVEDHASRFTRSRSPPPGLGRPPAPC